MVLRQWPDARIGVRAGGKQNHEQFGGLAAKAIDVLVLAGDDELQTEERVAPPMAASKALSAALAVPAVVLVLVPPTPVKRVGVPIVTGFPGERGTSVALSVLLMSAQKNNAPTMPDIACRRIDVFIVPVVRYLQMTCRRVARIGGRDHK
jgi:hypothetical protein